ncbi:MAG: beta-glucoside-specific PTS transporter subunit IIABC [Muribaculaceae bacterium]|nr:beta-glucoside-specific PTS transporter subunit IIABC [Muribaculaceae bacterium]
MSKKYEALAVDIVKLIGGKENVNGLHHCQTRLRFQLKDDKKADQQAIEGLDGVSKVLINGGMFQVVIGMDVADAYEEVTKLLGNLEGGAEAAEPGKKRSLFDIVTDFISSIFSPIVPALAGAGMVKALLAFLTAFHLIDTASSNYIILNMIGDATFAFMPILLAYTTAQKLKCNPILAAVTAGIMCHATWGTLVAAGEAVSFFGIPLYLVRYTGSVIPIVLVILVQARVEKFLTKVIPGAIRLVFMPMLTFIIMGALALSILGPLGDYVGMIFTFVFTWLSEHVGWLELGVLGGTYSILVIFGLHHGIAPIGTMQMAQMGYDGVFGPAVLCANIGQGTASLITGLLSKDSKTRQVGASAGITGLMGTTEPALYGINVPKKYPLIAGAIGAAFGGLYAGLTHTHRYATGSSGLPAVVMYIGDGSMQYFYSIIIALVITVVVSAVLTVIFFKKFEKETGISDTSEDASAVGTEAAAQEEVQGIKTETLVSPIKGTVIPLTQVADEAFSSEALGKGIAIEPEEGKAVAPCNGVVTVVFPTCHAFGIQSESGAEILLHIGINTVELDGKYFTGKVKQGDTVKAGDVLATFEAEKIRQEGYSLQTMLIITNTDAYQNIESAASGEIDYQKELLKLKAE